MKKTKSKEIEIIQKLEPLAEQALSLEITDKTSLKQATSLLSRLNNFNDSIEEEKNKVLTPLLEATKQERARWKPAEQYYKTAIDSIRLKMSTYQTKLVQTVKEEEARIASRIAPGKGHLSLETAIEKIEALPQIEKETATEDGLVQFREKKQLKVTDLSQIPKEYWHINEDLLLDDLKKGIAIPGAEIEIIMVPVNFR